MARQDFELFFKLRDGFTSGLQKAGDAVKDFGSKLLAITGIGAAVSAAIAAISTGLGFKLIIGEAADLEAVLKRVQSVTGGTAEDLLALRTAAESAAAGFGVPIEGAAAALESLARNGLN